MEHTFSQPNSNPNFPGSRHPEAPRTLVQPCVALHHDRTTFTVTVKRELIVQRMWAKQKKNSAGLCAICPTCGGSSMSFCACREEEFHQRVTDDALLNFLEGELGHIGTIVR